MASYKTIQHCLYEPEDKLDVNSDCRIYGDKGGLKSYHYEEMIKRLNDMDDRLGKISNDVEFIGIGHLLRMLWRRYEKELTVHTRSLYGGTHEQDIKSKKMNVEGFKFAKNEVGVYGIYTDLVYDTYQKDWSKAYQLTFHCFFTHIDYLANYMDSKFFSYTYRDFRFFTSEKKHQFCEVIVKDINNLLGDNSKLNAIHGLPKHEKAPLYDVICKVFDYDGNSNVNPNREQFKHNLSLRDEEKSDSVYLAVRTFAHMASSAIVNPLAFKVLKDYLPNACRMFHGILGIIALRLEKQMVDRYGCEQVARFHYKGTKQWGTLQQGFATTGHNFTLEQMLKLDEIGKQNARILNKLSLQMVKLIYEDTPGVGVRYVLSKEDEVENKVIDNFYTLKHGKKLSFDQNSKLSKKLHSYKPFQDYYENYLEVVRIMLREKTLERTDGGEIRDIFEDELGIRPLPDFSHIRDIYSHDYYGLMGAAQTIKVDLEVEQVSDASYRVKTKMYIGDWYGADYDDINGGNISEHFKFDDIDDASIPDATRWESMKRTMKKMVKIAIKTGRGMVEVGDDMWENKKGNTPSLNAFFWLQHHYGCHPFETEIIFEKTDTISL